MATATREKPIDPPVILTLTVEEASFLAKLCNRVGGPSKGPRGIADRIHKALHSVGINPTNTFPGYQIEGTINFRNNLSDY